MAPKRPAMQAPPPANPLLEEESSEEEIEEQEEQEAFDDEEEEEEDKEGEKASSPPAPPPPSSSNKKPSKKKTTVRPQSSSSTDGADESEEESDDSDPENPLKIAAIPDPKAKSLASKPTEQTSKSKKVNVTPVKRTAENEKEKDPKKEKTDEATTSKKPSFVRFWSEDDEIAILKGLSEYSSKKGIDPFQDMNGYHEFVKKSVRSDVSKSQLVNKIKRLKKKYKDKVSKGKNGEDPVFTKPHDGKAFVLSKKIWGREVEKTSGSVQSKKADGKIPKRTKSTKNSENLNDKEMPDVADKKENVPEREKKSEGRVCSSQKLEVPAPNEIWMQEGLELIPKCIRNELEEKRMAQEDSEIENTKDILELLRYQGKLVSMVLKSKNHSVI